MRAYILQGVEALGVLLLAVALGFVHPAIGVAVVGAYFVVLANQWR